MIALALLAAALSAGPAPRGEPPPAPPPPPAAERAKSPPRPEPPPRSGDEDAEVIRHLDELEKLELLRQLHLFDPDLDEEPPPGGR